MERLGFKKCRGRAMQLSYVNFFHQIYQWTDLMRQSSQWAPPPPSAAEIEVPK